MVGILDTDTMVTVTTAAPLTTVNTTTPWAPVFPSQDKCNYYIVNQTSYHWLDFGNPYGGIPQNLLLNAVSFSELTVRLKTLSYIIMFIYRSALSCCCCCSQS